MGFGQQSFGAEQLFIGFELVLAGSRGNSCDEHSVT